MKKRFRQVVWCKCCMKELNHFDRLCVDCGATYLNNRVDPYAVMEQEYVEPIKLSIKFKWYNPSTWFKNMSDGYWKIVKVRDVLGMDIQKHYPFYPFKRKVE